MQGFQVALLDSSAHCLPCRGSGDCQLFLAQEAILFVAGTGEPATAVAVLGMADGGAVVLEQHLRTRALGDEVLVPGKAIEFELGAVYPFPAAIAGLALDAKPDGRLTKVKPNV